MSVTVCGWCPDPHSPDPQSHPGGQAEHLLPASADRVKQWADIAYEMWALLCNSTTDGHSSPEEWTTARDRLRDRFHAALNTLPTFESQQALDGHEAEGCWAEE